MPPSTQRMVGRRMKVYKYRALSIEEDDLSLGRLERVVRHRAIWCAWPRSLNDPKEFAWKCDFTVSPETADLLADLLVRLKGRPRDLARRLAIDAIDRGSLQTLAEPAIAEMIEHARNGVGVACFGTSPDNPTLWQRYGADGSGVCVEVDVPDLLLGSQLHRVVYNDEQKIHIDDFLRSRFDLSYGAVIYASLLTKTKFWEPEDEVRFLSKRPGIEVVIDRSEVTQVFAGWNLEPVVTDRIKEIAGVIPVVSDSPPQRVPA